MKKMITTNKVADMKDYAKMIRQNEMMLTYEKNYYIQQGSRYERLTKNILRNSDSFVWGLCFSYLVIAKSNIATMMKTESDEHNAINSWLNAFRISGLDKMKILRAFPTNPKIPKINVVSQYSRMRWNSC